MLNKEKILAGVRACIHPRLVTCDECPYWNNGDKQCEELRMDIVEAIDSGIFINSDIVSVKPSSLTAKWVPIIATNKKFGVEVEVGYSCSWCEGKQEVKTNYCSHCGMKMIRESTK